MCRNRERSIESFSSCLGNLFFSHWDASVINTNFCFVRFESGKKNSESFKVWKENENNKKAPHRPLRVSRRANWIRLCGKLMCGNKNECPKFENSSSERSDDSIFRLFAKPRLLARPAEFFCCLFMVKHKKLWKKEKSWKDWMKEWARWWDWIE